MNCLNDVRFAYNNFAFKIFKVAPDIYTEMFECSGYTYLYQRHTTHVSKYLMNR